MAKSLAINFKHVLKSHSRGDTWDTLCLLCGERAGTADSQHALFRLEEEHQCDYHWIQRVKDLLKDNSAYFGQSSKGFAKEKSGTSLLRDLHS
jgi:hypothetical protein